MSPGSSQIIRDDNHNHVVGTIIMWWDLSTLMGLKCYF